MIGERMDWHIVGKMVRREDALAREVHLTRDLNEEAIHDRTKWDNSRGAPGSTRVLVPGRFVGNWTCGPVDEHGRSERGTNAFVLQPANGRELIDAVLD